MDATNLLIAARRGRWAVAGMFFINGFMTGSWAPQIPVLVSRLGISEFTLGLLILIFGIGALSFMPLSGWLMSRHGSRAVLRAFASGVVVSLLLVTLAPSVALSAAAMFLFGGAIGGMDVAMNANAVQVEKHLGRGIMSSSHGFWSLGGFAGGGMGGIAIQSFGHLAHAVAVTVIAFAVLAMAARFLAADAARAAQEPHHPFRLPTTPTIYLIGLISLFSMVPEGAILDWAALYLKDELGTDIATAGFPFAAFSGTMAVMRFLGDGVRNRFGAVTTLRVSSLVAAAGMLVAGLSPWPWLVIVAFAFSGLGIANMVPITFSAGGNQLGMAPGIGISIVTAMGYSGILVAPSAIGFIAERTGFSPVFIGLSGLLVVVCLMAGLARSADFKPQAAA